MATVDIVIPVLNEERALPPCVDKLGAFLAQSLSNHDWKIVIGDNGSTDGTLDVCKRLALDAGAAADAARPRQPLRAR